MATHRTAEEILKEQIDSMGNEFGSIYNRVYREVIFIHHKWSEFESLYGQGDIPIQSMNKFAPFFFYIVQNNLFDDVILSICRITDPIKSLGKYNITIQLFPEYVDEEIRSSISQQVACIISDSSFCRDRRNRIISHIDKELALNQSAKLLEPANRNSVNTLLKKIQELINSIEQYYFDSEVYFGFARPEGHSVLKWAEEGLKLDELKWKFLETGKLDASDFDTNED